MKVRLRVDRSDDEMSQEAHVTRPRDSRLIIFGKCATIAEDEGRQKKDAQ